MIATPDLPSISLTRLICCVLLMLGGSAAAATIFTEDFNSYAGNQNSTQADTGLEVAFGGSVAGWSASGAGVMHAVDLANLGGQSNPSDWAIMFWQDNVITQASAIAANESGTSYEVTFDYGAAVYGAGNYSQRTGAGDAILVEVLRADNSVLASNTFAPGAWDAGNYNLDGGLSGTLAYIGDGTGNVRLRIGPAVGNQSRFEGEIDNISVDLIPEPSVALLGAVGALLLLRRRRSD